MTLLHELRTPSPLGDVVLSLMNTNIVALAFAERAAWMRARVEARFPGVRWSVGKPSGFTLARAAATAALDGYFSGDMSAFDSVPTTPGGTRFQTGVYRALRAIPPGETRAYGELAKQLGSSARAVGGANAKNPISLFIPCHRVIGSDGALTGYAFGLERKRWLLAHERVHAAPVLVTDSPR